MGGYTFGNKSATALKIKRHNNTFMKQTSSCLCSAFAEGLKVPLYKAEGWLFRLKRDTPPRGGHCCQKKKTTYD